MVPVSEQLSVRTENDESCIGRQKQLPVIKLYVRKLSFSDELEFNTSPWTTLISHNPQRAPCGLLGAYVTPPELQLYDCHNLTTVDCTDKTQFKLVRIFKILRFVQKCIDTKVQLTRLSILFDFQVAYHCDTGIVYECKRNFLSGGAPHFSESL